MKIGPIDPKALAPIPAVERKPSATAAGTGNESSAQVALSDAASALSKVGTDPTFDSKKVERIAQAIRDGKFEINADAIANKLIENATELLGRKPN